jgi:hypothetical protein
MEIKALAQASKEKFVSLDKENSTVTPVKKEVMKAIPDSGSAKKSAAFSTMQPLAPVPLRF